MMKMQIWNGPIMHQNCRKPHKRYQCKSHFWVQDPKLWNGPLQGLTSHGHFWNSTFACTVQWCMQICHKPLSPSVQDQKLWNRLPRLEKDLNSFLSSGSKVVEWSSQGLTSHGHFWNSTFACTVQWCMQICHKPLSPSVQDQKLWNRPPRLEKDLNSFLSSGSKVVEWSSARSDISWTFLKFYFCMYCPMMHANLP